jgi:hypothetical protein
MCNCAGSTPRRNQQPRELRGHRERPNVSAQPQPRRAGGPGQEGYTWNGPPRKTN